MQEFQSLCQSMTVMLLEDLKFSFKTDFVIQNVQGSRQATTIPINPGGESIIKNTCTKLTYKELQGGLLLINPGGESIYKCTKLGATG